MNDQDSKRMIAFIKFEARANFVKCLAAELQIPTGTFGALCLNEVDSDTKNAFFTSLENYDARAAKGE